MHPNLARTTTARVCLVGVLLVASIASFAATPLPPAKPENVGMSSARLEKVGNYFKKEAADGRLPGGVIAVARDGKLVYFEAFGVQIPGKNAPMKNDAIFRIYSMTKPLTSVAAMLLVEDGVIELSDLVSKYLPEFAKMQVSVEKKGADGKIAYELIPADRRITGRVSAFTEHFFDVAVAKSQRWLNTRGLPLKGLSGRW